MKIEVHFISYDGLKMWSHGFHKSLAKCNDFCTVCFLWLYKRWRDHFLLVIGVVRCIWLLTGLSVLACRSYYKFVVQIWFGGYASRLTFHKRWLFINLKLADFGPCWNPWLSNEFLTNVNLPLTCLLSCGLCQWWLKLVHSTFLMSGRSPVFEIMNFFVQLIESWVIETFGSFELYDVVTSDEDHG